MAIPAIGMDIGTPAPRRSLPQDEPVVQTFNRVQEAFPAETASLTVVVKAEDVTAPAVAGRASAKLEQGGGAAHGPVPPSDGVELEVSPDKTVATLDVEIAGDGTDEESNRALDVLRDDVVPDRRSDRSPACEAYVDGSTARTPTSTTR